MATPSPEELEEIFQQRRAEHAKTAKALRQQYKLNGGANVHHMTDLKLPAEAAHRTTALQERMVVFWQAYDAFIMCKPGDAKSAFQREREYRRLYDDMREHEDDWFLIFSMDANARFAERCIGMLGTLATLYRQRQEYTKTAEVLELDTRVLDRYRDMTTRATDPLQQRCLDELTYKYNLIKYNLSMNVRKPLEVQLKLFKDIVRFELQTMKLEDTNFAFSLPMIRVHPTVANVERLDLRDYARLMALMEPFQELDRQPTEEAQLQRCDYCKELESMRGDLKRCGSCRLVAYCSKDCQRKDWRNHKAMCKLAQEAANAQKKKEQEEKKGSGKKKKKSKKGNMKENLKQ